jgi:hypothetical protein
MKHISQFFGYSYSILAIFEVSKAANIQVEFFRVVMPCSVVIGYGSFTLKMEAA